MKEFLKDILKMLDDALDYKKTDADESFDLLYEIFDKLERKINELEECEE